MLLRLRLRRLPPPIRCVSGTALSDASPSASVSASGLAPVASAALVRRGFASDGMDAFLEFEREMALKRRKSQVRVCVYVCICVCVSEKERDGVCMAARTDEACGVWDGGWQPPRTSRPERLAPPQKPKDDECCKLDCPNCVMLVYQVDRFDAGRFGVHVSE